MNANENAQCGRGSARRGALRVGARRVRRGLGLVRDQSFGPFAHPARSAHTRARAQLLFPRALRPAGECGVRDRVRARRTRRRGGEAHEGNDERPHPPNRKSDAAAFRVRKDEDEGEDAGEDA